MSLHCGQKCQAKSCWFSLFFSTVKSKIINLSQFPHQPLIFEVILKIYIQRLGFNIWTHFARKISKLLGQPMDGLHKKENYIWQNSESDLQKIMSKVYLFVVCAPAALRVNITTLSMPCFRLNQQLSLIGMLCVHCAKSVQVLTLRLLTLEW